MFVWKVSCFVVLAPPSRQASPQLAGLQVLRDSAAVVTAEDAVLYWKSAARAVAVWTSLVRVAQPTRQLRASSNAELLVYNSIAPTIVQLYVPF
jgi:hypothetical protein